MFEALSKVIEQQRKILGSKDIFRPQSEEHKTFYDICKGLPFYRWDYMLSGKEKEHNLLSKRMHGLCCFNHLIGLPEKAGIPHNLYHYEYNLYRELVKPRPKPTDDIVTRQQYKHVYVLKSTGLGISEFMLRFICWLSLRNDDLKGQRVCVVTGPNIALAITLIRRIKELFLNPSSEYQILFEGKETEVNINGVEIKSYPSHHIDSMRGLTNVAMVFLDEAAFFPINDAETVRDVSERYIGKSDPFIVLVSTPNKPSDIMNIISEQKESECIYKRFYMPYTVGIGNIYSGKDIQIAKRSVSFEREYNLQFLGGIGNVFDPRMIDKAIDAAKRHESYQGLLMNPKLQTGYDTMFLIGVDPSFGSSMFAIVLVAVLDDKICVLQSIELERQQFDYCVSKISEIMVKYNLNESNTKILVDASAPAVITAIKSNLGEEIRYSEIMAYRKKQGVRDLTSCMICIPVAFTAVEKKSMLLNVKELIDSNSLAIDQQRNQRLILGLRTAYAEDMILNKNVSEANDLIDALCLACKRVSIRRE